MNEKQAFQDSMNVSRETFEQLEIYAELLRSWNKRINLVSPKSLAHLWGRHFLDSAQVFKFGKHATRWADLGSGGGFPGAVCAILAGHDTDVTLIESDQRKAAFLRTLARETTGFTVLSERIENTRPQNADAVSARALAPLPKLLGYVMRHISADGFALLPKGKNADAEVREALEHWRFRCETYPSETDNDAVILKISEIARA